MNRKWKPYIRHLNSPLVLGVTEQAGPRTSMVLVTHNYSVTLVTDAEGVVWKGGMCGEFWVAMIDENDGMILYVSAKHFHSDYTYKMAPDESDGISLLFVCESLCAYDKRNPLFNADFDDTDKSNGCMCDCCFKGKSVLAEELFKYISINRQG